MHIECANTAEHTGVTGQNPIPNGGIAADHQYVIHQVFNISQSVRILDKIKAHHKGKTAREKSNGIKGKKGRI